uniref:Uncharacterized protein n=1 Tax=Mycena chlorophos TaxID=658473 RepID=A0ABQ0L1H9_MYCCL|nr:predicted protein [Mycena chlorophos]
MVESCRTLFALPRRQGSSLRTATNAALGVEFEATSRGREATAADSEYLCCPRSARSIAGVEGRRRLPSIRSGRQKLSERTTTRGSFPAMKSSTAAAHRPPARPEGIDAHCTLRVDEHRPRILQVCLLDVSNAILSQPIHVAT